MPDTLSDAIDGFDAIVIGAGIAGMYQLIRPRELGLCAEVAARGYEGFLRE